MDEENKEYMMWGIKGVGFVVMFFLVVISFIWGYCFEQAKVFNKRHGTKYTASDFFWNGDNIREVNVVIVETSKDIKWMK